MVAMSREREPEMTAMPSRTASSKQLEAKERLSARDTWASSCSGSAAGSARCSMLNLWMQVRSKAGRRVSQTGRGGASPLPHLVSIVGVLAAMDVRSLKQTVNQLILLLVVAADGAAAAPCRANEEMLRQMELTDLVAATRAAAGQLVSFRRPVSGVR